jgi:hypothetical protein
VLIDCDTCAVKDLQCGDCVMSVLLGRDSGDAVGSGAYEVDAGEAQALAVLAQGGLVPTLKLVPIPAELPSERAG